jgi:hypothetical protein
VLNFRKTEMYIKYMQLFSEVAKSSVSTLCHLLLSWFPGGLQDAFTKKKSMKKKTTLTKKPKTSDSQFISASKETVPLKWCYANWTENTPNFDSKNVLHNDLGEFFGMLIVADAFCAILKHKEPLDPDTYNLIWNNALEVFQDIPFRQYGVWFQHNQLLFDQWSFVVRRLSSTEYSFV